MTEDIQTVTGDTTITKAAVDALTTVGGSVIAAVVVILPDAQRMAVRFGPVSASQATKNISTSPQKSAAARERIQEDFRQPSATLAAGSRRGAALTGGATDCLAPAALRQQRTRP